MRYLIALSLLTVYSSYAQNYATDTIYREEDLKWILDGIAEDKNLQLERMTSLAFHQLLNEYRVKNGEKTLYWDDKIWMAARNHSIYMHVTLGDLMHNESEDDYLFTGVNPEDRVNYVTYYSNEYRLTGFENIAATSINDLVPGPVDRNYAQDLNWDELVEMAKNEAAEMFNLWKNSSGHNANMLDSDNLAHGTSIIYNDKTGTTFGTSVFAHVQDYYRPDTLELSFHSGWEQDFKIKYKENYQAIKDYPSDSDLLVNKLLNKFTIKMESMGIAHSTILNELLPYALPEESLKKVKKRYLRSTKYLGIFSLIKNRLYQDEFELQIVKDENIWQLPHEDLTAIIENNPSIYNAKDWAGKFKITEQTENLIKINFKIYTIVPKN